MLHGDDSRRARPTGLNPCRHDAARVIGWLGCSGSKPSPSAHARLQLLRDKGSKAAADLSAQRVLEELRRLAFSNIAHCFDPAGNLLPIQALPAEVRSAVASVKVIKRNLTTGDGVVSVNELHFHDLRREFACRLLESRAELHDVRDFLGHANITTTSRYLRSTTLRLERALTLLERHDAGTNHGAQEPPQNQRSSEKCHTGATRRVRRSRP